jgi:hypothetical protein
MEYTQEQINKLKSDPIVQLLSVVTGTPIDKMVSEIKVKDKKPYENLSISEESNDDSDPIYPFTKDDICAIVTVIKNVHVIMDKFTELGIDLWNTELGDAIESLIDTLLSYIDIDVCDIDGDSWINKDIDAIVNIILKQFNNE